MRHMFRKIIEYNYLEMDKDASHKTMSNVNFSCCVDNLSAVFISISIVFFYD